MGQRQTRRTHRTIRHRPMAPTGPRPQLNSYPQGDQDEHFWKLLSRPTNGGITSSASSFILPTGTFGRYRWQSISHGFDSTMGLARSSDSGGRNAERGLEENRQLSTGPEFAIGGQQLAKPVWRL